MENYCVGSRGEGFPAGLRVLVVDDDPTWLKILEKMLRKCFYEVTTCGLARTALDMLREKKDRFDIVISDVNMPDMDGFKLLEQVGLEMDLPVIMMSVDGETSRVMKGVQHGACDYLLKPVRMKELRNIWQHVFRKKIHEMKEVESHDSNELNDIRNKLEEFNEWQILSGGDVSSGKKRKDVDKEYIEQDFADAASVKKARVVWSVDLHQKFVNAVNQIGFDKVGPKKILDLMNVPGLTRENVASHLQMLNLILDKWEVLSEFEKTFHLQKYRLYLIRLQKQNEGRTLGEIVQSDISSTDSPGKFGVHSSITKQKSNSPNSCGSPGTRMHYEDMIQSTCVEDLKNVASFQVTDTRKAINNGTTEFLKLNNVSEFGVVTSSKERILGLDYDCNDSCISKQYQYGTDRNTTMQLMKQDQESSIYMKAYSQLQQLCEVHHLRDNQLHTPPVHALTSTAGEDGSPTRIKSTITFGSNHARNLPFACNIDLVSSQIEHRVMNTYHLEAASSVNCHRSTEAYSYGVKNSGCSPDSPSQNLDLKAEADLSPLDDLLPYSLPNYGRFESFGLNCLEVSEYNRQMPTTDIQINLCDELQYNSEYPFDLLEFPPLDDGLFT